MIRFLMDYAIACDSRSIVQNRTIAYNQRPCDIGGGGGAQGLWDNAILHFGKLRFSMHYCGLMFSCAFVLHFFCVRSLDCTNEFLI